MSLIVDDLSIIKAVDAVTPKASDEQIATALAKVQAVEHFAKEVRGWLKERMLEIIAARGEDITIGEVRYYAAHPTDVDCTDAPGLLLALMRAREGDIEGVARDYLSKDAFKQGACKEPLGDEWKRYFKTTQRTVLKEGKPVRVPKQLQSRPINLPSRRVPPAIVTGE